MRRRREKRIAGIRLVSQKDLPKGALLLVSMRSRPDLRKPWPFSHVLSSVKLIRIGP